MSSLTSVSISGVPPNHLPVTTEMQVFPAKQTAQGFKGGFETTFTIKRTDFGMDTYVANGGLGDDVTITVAVEGVGARP